jgi:hypothetical protein
MTHSKFTNRRCPKCGSKIDILGSCKKCGRAWSESLGEGEKALGLDDGQYPSEIPSIKPKARPKSRFTKTKSNEPPPFASWQIGAADDETEIIRKRSLMRLDSRRTYAAMGFSIRAQETQKAAYLWLSRLQEFLDEEEQKALAPTLQSLKSAFELLFVVRNAKVAQAVRMEKAMEKAHSDARRVRLAAAAKPKKARLPEQEQDSEGLGLIPIALDPQLPLEQAQEKILEREIAKEGVRNRKRNKGRAPTEEE